MSWDFFLLFFDFTSILRICHVLGKLFRRFFFFLILNVHIISWIENDWENWCAYSWQFYKRKSIYVIIIIGTNILQISFPCIQNNVNEMQLEQTICAKLENLMIINKFKIDFNWNYYIFVCSSNAIAFPSWIQLWNRSKAVPITLNLSPLLFCHKFYPRIYIYISLQNNGSSLSLTNKLVNKHFALKHWQAKYIFVFISVKVYARVRLKQSSSRCCYI